MRNESGFKPCDIKVVVYLDDAKFGEGIIKMVEDDKEKEAYKQTKGIIVDIGVNAFKAWHYDDESTLPKIGDRVEIGLYCGKVKEGDDGKTYRIVNDDDIWAILERNKK